MQDRTPLKEAGNQVDFEAKYRELLEAVQPVLETDDRLNQIVSQVTSGEYSPEEVAMMDLSGVMLTQEMVDHIENLRNVARG